MRQFGDQEPRHGLVPRKLDLARVWVKRDMDKNDKMITQDIQIGPSDKNCCLRTA